MNDLKAERSELEQVNSQPIKPRTIIRRQQAVAQFEGATLEAIAATHEQDADCTVNPENDCCIVCGVDHGAEPCDECGARAFHSDHCSLNEANIVDARASQSDPSTPTPSESLRQLVNYLEADPNLYEGDDDQVLGRLMHQSRRALEPTQSQPFEYPEASQPDPREKLIDELAAALDRITDYITDLSQGGRDYDEQDASMQQAIDALNAATSHQEARRHDQHSLVIDSLRDLRAHCSCGRWNLSCITSDAEPATQIRAHAADAHRLHVEGVRRA